MEEVKTKKSERPMARRRYLFLAGFLLGIFSFVAFRFVTVKNDAVHYHADFALYINGQKDDFKSFTFYEEVQSCSADDKNNVKARAHMHDNKAGLAHMHDNGVTWGQFFANLGYTLGNKVLVTDKGVFADGQDGNKLSFLLDGKTLEVLENRVIESGDKLVINYGKESQETIRANYLALPSEADKANTQNDPSTCSGNAGLTLTERFKAALGFPIN